MVDPRPAADAEHSGPEHTSGTGGLPTRVVAADGLQLKSETWREDGSQRTRTRAFWSGPAEPGIVREARDAVAAVAADGGMARLRVNDVRACVSEAVTNTILHAFDDDRTPGTITVSAKFNHETLTVVITDDGVGFLPRAGSPGMGLGLPIIGGLSDSMSIATAAGGGTEVSILFRLAGAPPSVSRRPHHPDSRQPPYSSSANHSA
jgi:serine/threonine-protein kinase RsbW